MSANKSDLLLLIVVFIALYSERYDKPGCLKFVSKCKTLHSLTPLSKPKMCCVTLLLHFVQNVCCLRPLYVLIWYVSRPLLVSPMFVCCSYGTEWNKQRIRVALYSREI